MTNFPLSSRTAVMVGIATAFTILCLSSYALNPVRADALFLGLAGLFLGASLVLSGWKGLPRRVLVLAAMSAFVGAFMFTLEGVFLYHHPAFGRWWPSPFSVVGAVLGGCLYLRAYQFSAPRE